MMTRTIHYGPDDLIFKLSEGEVTSVTYNYVNPDDIVRRAIYKGFSRANPMIKPAEYSLRVPRTTDTVLSLSTIVHGANFIQHLMDVRRALDDANHQFLAFNFFEDGMTVTSYHQTGKLPLMLFDVSSGEGITIAFFPTPEVSKKSDYVWCLLLPLLAFFVL
jgi:hypothetical protein